MSHWRTRLACVAAILLIPALAAGQPDIKSKDAIEPRAEIRKEQVADVRVARGQKSEAIVIDWTGDDLKVLHPAWIEVYESRDVKPRDARFKSAVSLQVSGSEDGRAEVYVVTTVAGPDGKARLGDPVRIRVTVGGASPVKTDTKDERPDVKTDAVKKTERLYVIVVEETNDPAGQGNLGPNRDVLLRWQREKPNNRRFLPIDQNAKDEFGRPVEGTLKHAIKQAAGKKLPYAVIYDNSDPARLKLLGGETLPADSAAAVRTISKYEK